MNKALLKKNIANQDVEELEKEAIFFYLKNRKLPFSKSELFVNYFNGFQSNEELSKVVEDLELKTFNDLEHLLELLIPKADRKLNGAFFTPEYIVDYIIKETSPKKAEKCIDPSCGCGAFLLGLIRYYKKSFDKSIKEAVRLNIFGSDILDYNIRRTKLLIGIFGLEND